MLNSERCRSVDYIFFPMIQSAILPRPRHPPLSFNSSSQQHNCRRAISHSLFFERIRGFRFSMAAGSQSVESWAKKLDPVQLGKKIHFSLEIARCSTRARLPAAGDAFAYVLTPFTRETFSNETLLDRYTKIRAGWAGAG